MIQSPIERRLLDLQLLARPEDKEERELLEDYLKWRAEGGPARFKAQQAARVRASFNETYAGILDREVLTGAGGKGVAARTKTPL